MYRKRALFSLRRLGVCCFTLLAGLGSEKVFSQKDSSTEHLLSTANKGGSIVKTDILSFEMLARGDSYTAEFVEPQLVFAVNSHDASRMIGFLDSHHLTERVRSVDFERSWIFGIFRGQMGSTGYGIVIQKITIINENVRLQVKLTDPAPAQNVSDVITNPYHIVVLPRANFQPTPQTTWLVYTPDGRLLLKVKNPSIP